MTLGQGDSSRSHPRDGLGLAWHLLLIEVLGKKSELVERASEDFLSGLEPVILFRFLLGLHGLWPEIGGPLCCRIHSPIC